MIVKTEVETRRVTFKHIRDDSVYTREKPYRLHKIAAIAGLPLTNVAFDSFEAAEMVDVRDSMECLDLEIDSFKFLHHPSKIKLDDSVDTIREYCQESVEILKSQVKADRVICYEILKRHANAAGIDPARKRSMPIEMVHIDHTPEGGKFRIKHHLTRDEIAEYSSDKWRWRIINIWRPLCTEVQDMPLAILDPKSVDPRDILETDQVGPQYAGETSYVRFNPNQRWYWLRNQTCEEVTLFTCFDSHAKHPYSNSCPHASFKDDTAPKNCPPRESVELRCIVLSRI